MKIVFIGGRDIQSLGGIESYMYNLSLELIKLGHIPVVYCESNKNYEENIRGIKVIYLKGTKNNIICKPWCSLKATIRTIFKERDVDLIHYNTWPPSLWSFIPNLFGIKTLMQGHGFEWKHTKYNRFQVKILKIMEGVTAHTNKHLIMCSEEQTRFFKEKYHVDATTIPTAVHLPKSDIVEEERCKIIKAFGLTQKKYFLFLGRLSKEKNIDFLIKAFNLVETDDFKLAIAGSNTREIEFVQYLKSLKIDDKVLFLGNVSGKDKDVLLDCAYCFCLPSSTEGLSIALLEAISYKLPIIASNIEANKEACGDNAIYVEPENTEALAKAINDTINTPQIFDGFTQKNYDNIKEHYTWDKVAKKYVSFLYSLGIK